MKLTHRLYKEEIAKAKIVADVKEKIRLFVGKGEKSYEEIVKHIQKDENIINDDIVSQIKEISKEADFIKPVEEIEIIDIKVK